MSVAPNNMEVKVVAMNIAGISVLRKSCRGGAMKAQKELNRRITEDTEKRKPPWSL